MGNILLHSRVSCSHSTRLMSLLFLPRLADRPLLLHPSAALPPAASRMPRPQTPRRTEPEKTMEFNRGYFCAHAFHLQNANFEATSQQLLTGSPNSLSIRSTVDLGRRGSWIWSVAAVDLEGPESSSPDCDDDSGRRIIINF